MAGYVQDDFRVTNALTVTAGLRYEYETGLAETDNRMTVGFDREAAFPVQVPGMNLRGGLMYAGVDGYQTYQADPSGNQFAPRVGATYVAEREDRGARRLRIVLGADAVSGPGRDVVRHARIHGDHHVFRERGRRTDAGGHAHQSVPERHRAAAGQRGRPRRRAPAATSTSSISSASRPTCSSSRSICSANCPAHMVVSAGYVGSRSDRLSVGGTADATVNINQIPTEYLSLGSALQQTVANPFFGNAAFGALSRSATIARGQLLRPYPQFGNVFAHRVTEAKARYHSMVLKAEKRITDGWGARVNYTWSRMEDNQFGETNFFANRGALLDNYDLDREYGLSLLDTPHRVNISGTFELPFGEGKRWNPKSAVVNAHRRRMGRDRHRHVSERLPGADLPVEQQLGPARQRAASERGVRRRSRHQRQRHRPHRRLVQHGGVEPRGAVHARRRAAHRRPRAHAAEEELGHRGAEDAAARRRRT